MKENTMKYLLTLLITTKLLASNVAIIDSGVDYKHKALKNQMWINPIDNIIDNRDQDHNGYEDDIYGWNFANNNSEIIDYSFLGTFSKDPYKVFEIQARMFLGTITEEDKAWLKSKREDAKFAEEMGVFGNFVHGTHVAGIVASHNKNAKIMGLKLIPTKVKLGLIKSLVKTISFKSLEDSSFRDKLLKNILTQIANQQSKLFIEIGDYLAQNKIDIANGSFGIGYNQAANIIKYIYPIIFFKKADEASLKTYSKYFINQVAILATEMTRRSPNTLFVFAAGNDGLNNDEFGTSPANIVAPNSITIAASFGQKSIANFSNFGVRYVHVAAPGVIINSAIPGDEYLKVSGTSQASPYVAGVASKIKDLNPSLTPEQIKNIIIRTVDKKDFLASKIASPGIVNPERAYCVAQASMMIGFDWAFGECLDVDDQVPAKVETTKMSFTGEPIQMTELYKIEQ